MTSEKEERTLREQAYGRWANRRNTLEVKQDLLRDRVRREFGGVGIEFETWFDIIQFSGRVHTKLLVQAFQYGSQTVPIPSIAKMRAGTVLYEDEVPMEEFPSEQLLANLTLLKG